MELIATDYNYNSALWLLLMAKDDKVSGCSLSPSSDCTGLSSLFSYKYQPILAKKAFTSSSRTSQGMNPSQQRYCFRQRKSFWSGIVRTHSINNLWNDLRSPLRSLYIWNIFARSQDVLTVCAVSWSTPNQKAGCCVLSKRCSNKVIARGVQTN